MRFSLSLIAACCSIATIFASPSENPSKRELKGSYDHEAGKPQCKAKEVYVRKEWRILSKPERKHYIDAVLCLRSKKPSLYSPKEIPGVGSRYDDFQVTHINQTFFIHFNGQFLSWHRWFVWTYEQTLRKECGYKGYQPYWDWSKDAHDIFKSPVLDGSPYSMSGNGAPTTHASPNTTIILDLPTSPKATFTFPGPTKGGGCVETGPFAHQIVPFGLIDNGVKSSELYNLANFAHKPHCLTRDLNSFLAKNALQPANVAHLLASPNITVFNSRMDFAPLPGSYVTMHAAGHETVGGDMEDTFSSPGDPLFFLHHAQIDRLWTLWQSRDPKTRQYAIDGPGSALGYPPTPDPTIETKIDLGKLGKAAPIKEFMDTRRGRFCYGYA